MYCLQHWSKMQASGLSRPCLVAAELAGCQVSGERRLQVSLPHAGFCRQALKNSCCGRPLARRTRKAAACIVLCTAADRQRRLGQVAAKVLLELQCRSHVAPQDISVEAAVQSPCSKHARQCCRLESSRSAACSRQRPRPGAVSSPALCDAAPGSPAEMLDQQRCSRESQPAWTHTPSQCLPLAGSAGGRQWRQWRQWRRWQQQRRLAALRAPAAISSTMIKATHRGTLLAL